jgi:hypothetical protein
MKEVKVKYYIDANKEIEESNFYADLGDGKCVEFSLPNYTSDVKKIIELKNLELVEISLESYKIMLEKFSKNLSLKLEQEDEGSDSFVFSNGCNPDEKEDEFDAKTIISVSIYKENYYGYSHRDEEELGIFIAELMKNNEPMILANQYGKFKHVIGPKILQNSSIEITAL